jgi:hypothetical protein
MMFEDAEMNDDPVGDCLSGTGTSQFRVKWKMGKEYQKFWLWTPAAENDLGDEEWDGRSAEEIWQCMRHRNCNLKELREYLLHTDQREICWKDLPVLKVTAVSRVIPSGDRGVEVRLIDINSASGQSHLAAVHARQESPWRTRGGRCSERDLIDATRGGLHCSLRRI